MIFDCMLLTSTPHSLRWIPTLPLCCLCSSILVVRCRAVWPTAGITSRTCKLVHNITTKQSIDRSLEGGQRVFQFFFVMKMTEAPMVWRTLFAILSENCPLSCSIKTGLSVRLLSESFLCSGAQVVKILLTVDSTIGS